MTDSLPTEVICAVCGQEKLLSPRAFSTTGPVKSVSLMYKHKLF